MSDRIDTRLMPIAQALYLREYSRVSAALGQEAEITRQLSRLAGAGTAGLIEPDGDFAHKGLGGEALWRGWVDAARRDLNMALARSRATRIEATRAAEAALSRCEAIRTLSHQARRDDRQRRRRREFEQLIERACLRS